MLSNAACGNASEQISAVVGQNHRFDALWDKSAVNIDDFGCDSDGNKICL